MKLSPRAERALQRATEDFVARVADLVAGETKATIQDALRHRLAELTGESSPLPRREPWAPRTRTARFGKGATVERLVEVLRSAGGTAAPGAVSKALGLSPERRRALVAKAVAAGLVRTQGERRERVYVLA